MKSNVKLHVLWIDDQDLKGAINKALEEFNIELVRVSCWEEATPLLENSKFKNWDAIILDCYCKVGLDDVGENDRFLKIVLHELAKIVGQNGILPWYILSAGHHDNFNDIIDRDLNDDRLQWDSEWKQIYYGKNKRNDETGLLDMDCLFSNIVNWTKNHSASVKLKRKFKDIFDLPKIRVLHSDFNVNDGIDSDSENLTILSTNPENIDSDLLQILPYLEEEKSCETNVFNQIRMTLEWVMSYLKEIEILPFELKGKKLNECSKFIGDNNFSDCCIPVDIQRSFHSCVTVANNGSHRLSVFERTKCGIAPYLIRSTIFDLLNILSWCKILSNDTTLREKIATNINIKSIPSKKNSSDDTSSFEGLEDILILDGEVLHIGQCCVYENNKDKIGQKVKLTNIIENTNPKTKQQYPYYAKHCYLVDESHNNIVSHKSI